MTDAFRHRTTPVFATYAELARVRYLVDVLRPDRPFERMPLILARLAIDFRSPILFGQEVVVETRVDRIGRSSLAMTHRMTATPDDRVVADVDSVLVAYDYAAGQSMPVPDEWRGRIGDHEARPMTDPRPDLAAAT